MGTYTELIFGARLKEGTPKDVIDTLLYMVNNDDEEPENLSFKTKSERNPINGGGSYYFAINNSLAKMYKDNISKAWHISSRCNIKNYENEIEDFLQWIKPHIDQGSGEREIYAIVIHEYSSEPVIYYLEDE